MCSVLLNYPLSLCATFECQIVCLHYTSEPPCGVCIWVHLPVLAAQTWHPSSAWWHHKQKTQRMENYREKKVFLSCQAFCRTCKIYTSKSSCDSSSLNLEPDSVRSPFTLANANSSPLLRPKSKTATNFSGTDTKNTSCSETEAQFRYIFGFRYLHLSWLRFW